MILDSRVCSPKALSRCLKDHGVAMDVARLKVRAEAMAPRARTVRGKHMAPQPLASDTWVGWVVRWVGKRRVRGEERGERGWGRGGWGEREGWARRVRV